MNRRDAIKACAVAVAISRMPREGQADTLHHIDEVHHFKRLPVPERRFLKIMQDLCDSNRGKEDGKARLRDFYCERHEDGSYRVEYNYHTLDIHAL